MTTICTKSPYLAAKNGSDRFAIIGKLDHEIVEDLGRQSKLGWKSRDGKDLPGKPVAVNFHQLYP